MIEKATLQEVNSFLHDEGIVAFVVSHIDQYMPWEQFENEGFPPGTTAEFMWEVIEFIRLMDSGILASKGIRKDLPNQEGWFNISSEMSSLLTSLYHSGYTSGALNHKIRRYQKLKNQYPLLSSDIVAASVRDGISIEPEKVFLLLTNNATPCTPHETVICNALDIIQNLDKYTEYGTNQELYNLLLKKLERGVEHLDYFPRKRPPTKHNAYESETLSGSYSSSNIQKNVYLEKINTYTDNYMDHGQDPIISTLLFSDLILEIQPFPKWNGFMEVILRRLAFLKIHVEALGCVPLSKKILDWELGIGGTKNAPFKFGEALLRSSYGNNIAPYILQLLHFLNEGLCDLDHITASFFNLLSEAEAIILEDYRLNHRQQKALIDSLHNPSITITVADYQKEHDVVPVTARKDLRKLVDFGFLQYSTDGRKQIFYSTDSLLEKVVNEKIFSAQ